MPTAHERLHMLEADEISARHREPRETLHITREARQVSKQLLHHPRQIRRTKPSPSRARRSRTQQIVSRRSTKRRIKLRGSGMLIKHLRRHGPRTSTHHLTMHTLLLHIHRPNLPQSTVALESRPSTPRLTHMHQPRRSRRRRA